MNKLIWISEFIVPAIGMLDNLLDWKWKEKQVKQIFH